MKALGMIEVYGYLAAVEALDASLKAANVSLLSVTCVKGGLVTVMVTGDVGATRAAIDAGAAAAERVGKIISVHVIPRPADSIDKMLGGNEGYKPGNNPSPASPGTEKEIPVSGPEYTQTGESRNETGAKKTGRRKKTTDSREQIDLSTVNENSLRSMTVAQLRKMARDIKINNMTSKEIRFAQKQRLIEAICLFIGQGS